MSTESTYLSQLARAYVSGRATAAPPPGDLDWEKTVHLLQAHNLATSLAPLIVDSSAPESVRNRLEAVVRNLYRCGALLWLEWGRILPALTEVGIECVLLKGLPLAHTVYSRPEHRTSLDIDVLVPRSSFDEAREVLRELGYVASRKPRHATFYEQHHFHLVLENANNIVVELHWNLSRPGDYCQFDLDGFVKRSRAIDLDGVPVRVPSDEDQLLHAACQSLRHGYADLRRVLDAALLLRHATVDSELLSRLARRQGMATPLWVLLALQRSMLGETVPAVLEEAVRPVTVVRRCLESLDLPERSALQDAAHHTGFTKLLICLCAPDAATALLELKRYVFPERGQWLDMGHDPSNLPGRMRRCAFAVRRCLSLAKILGYLGLRLIRG
jgi:hypothetical protein